MWETNEDYSCPIYTKMRDMLSGAKSRATRKGQEFNLDLEHMSTLYLEICPILGIDLVWDNTGAVVHGSPSLDRINNKQGYIKGNVQIISHRANGLKKDYLLVEWEKMTQYMQSGGGKVEITEQHFKEPVDKVLPQSLKNGIKQARSKGETVEDIAYSFDLPFGLVCRYAIQLEK